ncbi:hypothetical protein BaRGS_00024904 [Batillaria attramentaria]|uniref:Uncharacterized protein n=1 Tax=Batillaria attramentaria TaxID=370345 RepID=A0ABD0KA43_9CAEN
MRSQGHIGSRPRGRSPADRSSGTVNSRQGSQDKLTVRLPLLRVGLVAVLPNRPCHEPAIARVAMGVNGSVKVGVWPA